MHTNVVPTKYDDEGIPYWESKYSPVENKVRAEALVPPEKVIPIIFVPGIMGSNLKSNDAYETPVWRPDNSGFSDLFLTPADRQKKLAPNVTTVDTRIEFKGYKFKGSPVIGVKAAQNRGWGSVMWGSYGEVLNWLEVHMNSARFYVPSEKKIYTSAIWKPLVSGSKITNGELKLNDTELDKLADYYNPVHAVGYNWLQSNEDSGKYLATEIERIIKFYKKKFGQSSCEKVILVTHSMGGLVARAAVHPQMGNAADKVLGVFHGAKKWPRKTEQRYKWEL